MTMAQIIANIAGLILLVLGAVGWGVAKERKRQKQEKQDAYDKGVARADKVLPDTDVDAARDRLSKFE